MVDIVTPERRSQIMANIRSKDMKPEMAVRRAAHRLGYRFRLHRKDLPGKPDLVFPGRKKVVFVHGCFWHWHDDPKCKIARLPKSKLEYWKPKLERTRLRDKKYLEELEKLGWDVLVIWECELKNNEKILEKLAGYLGD